MDLYCLEKAAATLKNRSKLPCMLHSKYPDSKALMPEKEVEKNVKE